MHVLFDTFGTVPVLVFLLVVQFFILRAIISGKFAQVVRLLMVIPFLALILFVFFMPLSKNNRETAQTAGSAAESAASSYSAVSGDKNAGNESEFKMVSIAENRNKPFQKVSSNQNPANVNDVAAEHKANTTLAPVAPPPSAFRPTANTQEKADEEEHLEPPKPLVPYPNSSDPVRSADYKTNSPDNAPAALPAHFETNAGKVGSLQIKPEALELTPEKTNSLIEYFSQMTREHIEETRPAVVHIEATVMKDGNSKKTSVETGGGVIVKTGRGDFYVITNNHVAGNAVSNEDVRIVLHDHRVLHPTKVLPCPEFDLALLPLAEKNLIAAPLGDSDKVKMVDQVFAVGSPFGLEGSISSGIISGTKRRELPIGNKGQFQNFLQTDAAINPGNSGGPLLNNRGQVIGIVTVIATKSGANEGVGLAIPINHVKHVAGRLIRDGVYRRPFIGLDLDRDFDVEQKAALGLQRKALDGSTGETGEQFIGTRILHVKPNSPASQAGLREGDIIIAYNGNIVEDGDDFNHLIGLSTVDESPVLDILRGSERLQLSPKLTASH